MHLKGTAGILALAALGACGGEDQGRASSSTFPTGVTIGGSLSDSATSGSDSDSVGGTLSGTDTGDTVDPSDGSGSDEPKFDVGSAADLNQGEPDECTKVDILFAIDNSGSIGD